MKKILFAIMILVLVGCTTEQPMDTTQAEHVGAEVTPDPVETPDEPVTDSAGAGEVVEYSITGENFKFVMDGVDNPELRVKKGTTVRIKFSSAQGFHDWVVDEFDAATERVRDGEGTTSVEFVADKTGTFEYYCSVGSHRENGMWGSLVVE